MNKTTQPAIFEAITTSVDLIQVIAGFKLQFRVATDTIAFILNRLGSDDLIGINRLFKKTIGKVAIATDDCVLIKTTQ